MGLQALILFPCLFVSIVLGWPEWTRLVVLGVVFASTAMWRLRRQQEWDNAQSAPPMDLPAPHAEATISDS